MNVFEISIPGTWVKMEDRDLAWKVEGYIRSIHSYFDEAVMVLELFMQAQAEERKRFAAWADEQPSEIADPEWDRQLQELSKKMRESPEDSHKHMQAWNAQMLIMRRQKWASGGIPAEYSQTLPRFYARGFLFSVWLIGRVFDRVAQCKGVPPACKEISAQFRSAMPGLKGMRDSSAHIDERIDGMARGKKIETQPVDSGPIKVPGNSIMFIENLVNNKFTGTIEDGSLAEVEVSPETLVIVQQKFQELINAFSWFGVGRLCPES